MNGYTLGRLREQAKWPTGAPIWLPLKFCIFAKRLFYKKKPYKSSDCSTEAIRRSSWPICYCLEKSNWTHTHAHTHTHTHTQLLKPCGACAPRVNNKDQCILPFCNLLLNCCVLSPGSKHADTKTMPIHSVLRVSFLFSVFTYLRHQSYKSIL